MPRFASTAVAGEAHVHVYRPRRLKKNKKNLSHVFSSSIFTSDGGLPTASSREDTLPDARDSPPCLLRRLLHVDRFLGSKKTVYEHRTELKEGEITMIMMVFFWFTLGLDPRLCG